MLAHQGGWDEILMVAGPLLVFAGVLYLANQRANAKLAAAGDEDDEDTEDEELAADQDDGDAVGVEPTDD